MTSQEILSALQQLISSRQLNNIDLNKPLTQNDLRLIRDAGGMLSNEDEAYASKYSDGYNRIFQQYRVEDPSLVYGAGTPERFAVRWLAAGNNPNKMPDDIKAGYESVKKIESAKATVKKLIELGGGSLVGQSLTQAIQKASDSGALKGLSEWDVNSIVGLDYKDWGKNRETEGTGTTPAGVNPGQGLDLTQLNGQQLFMKIYNGEIIPDKNNPAWSALYQNGTATPAQIEAYQKWSLYTQQNPNDPKVKTVQQANAQAIQTGNYNTATTNGMNNGETGATGSTGSTDTTANSGTSTTTTSQNSTSNLTLAYSQIDKAVAEGLLTADQSLMYKEIVKNWDPAQEINTANVLDQFKKLKTETIDPYFKSQTDFYINDLTKTLQEEQATRDIALETERANAGDAIRQAKEGQEKAGMTFSGKGIEALGNQSAYATPEQQAQAQQSGIPLQTPFGGTGYYEGTVNQSNRLMSSSSQQRYNETLRNLGKSAESTLGSLGTSGIIPGYSPSGGITGTLADEKSQKYANTFTDLMDQERQNVAYRQPITIN